MSVQGSTRLRVSAKNGSVVLALTDGRRTIHRQQVVYARGREGVVDVLSYPDDPIRQIGLKHGKDEVKFYSFYEVFDLTRPVEIPEQFKKS
jgi:hypothetical protein